MRVFLSGPMGVGKSTVGPIVASALGLRFVDLDEAITVRAGKSVSRIFAEDGEDEFRSLERQLALEFADGDPVVLALGGGTVTHADTRRALIQRGILVSLEAPVELLAERVGRGEGRPLLRGGAREALHRLVEERAAVYAEAHARISTYERGVDEVAAEVVGIVRRGPIVVPLGQRSYTVDVGRGVLRTVRDRLPDVPLVVVCDSNTTRYADELELPNETRVELAPGEAHKTIDAVARIWDAALDARVGRAAIVVAVGGGVVGDIAGFAAATLMRGVRFVQVPTTVLAMVDSSVGGKTGVNRPAGKNLVGAFHQPEFVVCDVDTLLTLDPGERRAGLAEAVKAAWIEGEAAVAAMERDAERLREGDPDATAEAVRRAVRLKAEVVADDERESGRRRVLNLGHTIGHGIEAACGFGSIRHGDAVALGMIAACRVGGAARSESRLRALLETLGLPTDLDDHLSDDVFRLARADKKRVGDRVLFVIPGAPGELREESIPFESLEARVRGTSSGA